jgi:predicted DNA-binding transcriptional regulator AlpA
MQPEQFDRIVKEKERHAITGMGRTRWNELEYSGRAPRRVHLGPRAVGWRLSALQRWIAELPTEVAQAA